ncbi:hypothetical protein [Natrialba taiwanensis]|uniref:CARDB domain-containing protein n=1 Tax=Natrialba taiwanensis DSM 12281 TaxID=1230458 RepID=L9ZSN3_9EURY|nr:hypothetical protein C484_13880 [Natrialba taiwanensis DSM 12281]
MSQKERVTGGESAETIAGSRTERSIRASSRSAAPTTVSTTNPTAENRHRSIWRGSRLFVVVLVVLSLGTAGLLTGGITASAVADPTTDSLAPSASASLSTSTSDTGEYDDTVVVRFADDHVVTGSAAESMPSDPVVTAGGEELVVVDGAVETETGDEIVVGNNTVRVAENDPDLVVTDGEVLNDTLEVTDGGIVQTVEGETTVETDDGKVVEYTNYDETNFVPEIVDTNSPGEGETLEVTVEITNTEYGTATRDVDFTLTDGDETFATLNESIELDGGESTTHTFEYETERDDHEATRALVEVDYDGNEDDTDVTIHESKATVTIADWTRNTAAGDELEVTAEINRHGNYPQGEQEFLIEFRIDGTHVTTKPVSMEPGGQAVETFTYETTEADSPSVEAVVRSGLDGEPDDTARAVAEVIGQATHEENVRAQFADRNRPDEGETLELEAEIEYDRADRIPNEPKEYPIEFYIDGELVDNRTVELNGDETVTETFTYETEQGDAPRVDAELKTPGTGDTARPRINGSGFNVEIIDVNGPVNETQPLVATVGIENTGDITGKQEIRLRIDSGAGDPDQTTRHIRGQKNVSLEVGERTTERFSYRTRSSDVPLTEVAILSDDDEATQNAMVRAKTSRYEPRNLTGDYRNESSRELTLAADINNTGTEPGDQYVEFSLDGELVHVDRVTLEPWESETVSATIDAPEEIGAHDFAVETDDDRAETLVGVGVEVSGSDPDTDGTGENQSVDGDTDSGSDGSPSTATSGGGIPWHFLGLSLLGLLVVFALAALFLLYRHDPENFPPEPAAVPGILQTEVNSLATRVRTTDLALLIATAKRAIGLSAGTLIVRNDLPRAATVRVRCQTATNTVFLEDFELQPEERRVLGSLPDTDQFKVGAGVDDITSHEEVFDRDNGDVGVVLRAEGIVIGNLS